MSINTRLTLAFLCLLLCLVTAACANEEGPGSGSSGASVQAPEEQPSDAPAKDTNTEDEDEVGAAFEAFRSSVLQGNAEEFAEILAQPTLEHYEVLRGLALAAPKSVMRDQPIGDQSYALFLRNVFSADRLADLDGEDIARIFIEEGVIGPEGVDEVQAGEIKVSDSVATVEADIRGLRPFFYTFRLESGGWKVDLVELEGGAEFAFRQQMREYDLSEEKYVLTLVKVLSGSPPPDDIWQPPRLDSG